MPAPERVYFGFELPLDLRKRAKIKATQDGTYLGTVLVDFLEEYVGNAQDEQVSA